MSGNETVWHGTTILSVHRNGRVVIAGDGQVTQGQTVMKPNAKKVRRLGDGSVIAGFAGATADAFTLFERLEAQETMLRLLDLAQRGEGVQIFIGSESGLFDTAGLSMVVAPIRNGQTGKDARIVGAIGEALVVPLARGEADARVLAALETFTLRALGAPTDRRAS